MFKSRSDHHRADRRRACRVTLVTDPSPSGTWHATPDDPHAQVELVHQTIEKLDEVKHLVMHLAELPVGSRQDLLNQLAATSANLRSLYFLDAIY